MKKAPGSAPEGFHVLSLSSHPKLNKETTMGSPHIIPQPLRKGHCFGSHHLPLPGVRHGS
jgi:hypothetical protein